MNASMTNPARLHYVGSFRHNLDAKNRLTIPSKWRFAGDDQDAYLALPHPGGYIVVLPPAQIERLHQQVTEVKLGDRDGQDFINRFFAEAHSLGCDKQGRIGLADGLVRHAGVEKECLLVGSLIKFSIWSPERWEQLNERTSGDSFADLMQRLEI